MFRLISGLGTLVFACLGIILVYNYLLPIPFMVLMLCFGYYFKGHLEQKGENEYLKNCILVLEEKLKNVQPLTQEELEILSKLANKDNK